MELLWLTNIPTPYTEPLWRELGKLIDLHVACMAQSESNRQWTVGLQETPCTILGARAFKLGGEATFYAPTRGLIALFRERPQVVVLDGWESPAFWQARLLARWFGVRVMLSYWSTGQTHRFRSGPVAWFRGRWFRTADAVLTPGPAAAQAVRDMGVSDDKITTSFGTVDVEHFSRRAREIRSRLAPRPGHHFLYVGQLIERKNVSGLLDAFSQMRSEHDTLTIVGSGPLESTLRARAEHVGLDSWVTFKGHLEGEELIRAYAEAATLVLPSLEEAWGLVVNEALAAGLSVMVSDHCGVAGTVKPMGSVVVARTDSKSLADAMIRVQREPAPTEDHGIHQMTPEASARYLMASLSTQRASSNTRHLASPEGAAKLR